MPADVQLPRLVVAGLAGDAGKTLVSLGLVHAFASRGLEVRGFKKGPDYIDAAWLTWAAGRPARNLDTFLMGPETARESFVRHAIPTGINLVEGNRGLFDGVDAAGTHSTAELAKLLDAPVVLVVDATKATRTIAALVLGCQRLDPDVPISGVVLNRVAGARHERVIREAIESACGVPVLGALPKLRGEGLLPDRHLGLVPPDEHRQLDRLRERLANDVVPALDIDRLLAVARRAADVSRRAPVRPSASSGRSACRGRVTIGYLRDAAFTFYYPENLEALEAEGAMLVAVSALEAERLPDALDALYVGGGFPETHAARLSANRAFLESLAGRARAGLPVYAECGGLMLLAGALQWQGESYPMAGVLPCDVTLEAAPQGHGYVELSIDQPNPFFRAGQVLRGHEFHYSRIIGPDAAVISTAAAVRRGTGSLVRRDGIVVGNTWASYTHIHALGCSAWAPAFVRLARDVARR
jgi:cobyrinic acid a,c-diamide synthase